MKIFLSYSHEQAELAERLALALQDAGENVFWDRNSLPPGLSFDDRIRNAVQHSHLFITLVSKDSLRQGSYAVSELRFAEEKWPRPTGKILPVLVDSSPIESLPPYVRAVTVLQPRGDLVAEVLDSVAQLRKQQRTRQAIPALCSGLLLLLLAGIWFGYSAHKPRTAFDDNRPTAPTSNQHVPTNVASDQPQPATAETNAAETAPDANRPVHAPLTKPQVSLDAIVVTALPGLSGKPSLRFAGTVSNGSREPITIVEFHPESDDSRVLFPSSSSNVDVAPGQHQPFSVEADLKNDAKIDSFRWRICWVYLNTSEFFALSQNQDADQFISSHSKKNCNSWQKWKAP